MIKRISFDGLGKMLFFGDVLLKELYAVMLLVVLLDLSSTIIGVYYLGLNELNVFGGLSVIVFNFLFLLLVLYKKELVINLMKLFEMRIVVYLLIISRSYAFINNYYLIINLL